MSSQLSQFSSRIYKLSPVVMWGLTTIMVFDTRRQIIKNNLDYQRKLNHLARSANFIEYHLKLPPEDPIYPGEDT